MFHLTKQLKHAQGTGVFNGQIRKKLPVVFRAYEEVATLMLSGNLSVAQQVSRVGNVCWIFREVATLMHRESRFVAQQVPQVGNVCWIFREVATLMLKG
ncbi:MAG: hypothetical protein F6K19_23160 [Cyanothece sp. SIO1E1]|nr:hypothetical protein [Cyanothece sp. SIO1E1]